jgi:flagellar basal-body rod modification protein FlgD
MVDAVTTNTAINQQTKTADSATKLSKDYTQFLRLLTTQLQNQDPLSPMDTNEMTNQIVAFSQVEQQINMNQKLDSLVSLNLGNALNSSLGYVGMDVNYVSSEFSFDGTNNVKINYALNAPSEKTKIKVLDETGKTIFEATGSKETGKKDFVWDGSLSNGGKATKGTYAIRIEATDKEDIAIGSTTIVPGRVRGVETQNGAINLLIGDRAVPLSNVLNVSKPETSGQAI